MKKPLARVLLTLELKEIDALPPGKVTAHPAAKAFPGEVPADAPRMTRKIEIDTSIPAWHSTGLYAAPGEMITVTVPESAKAGKLAVRIGAHKDRNWHHDSWRRAPEISKSFAIAATKTKAKVKAKTKTKAKAKAKTRTKAKAKTKVESKTAVDARVRRSLLLPGPGTGPGGGQDRQHDKHCRWRVQTATGTGDGEVRFQSSPKSISIGVRWAHNACSFDSNPMFQPIGFIVTRLLEMSQNLLRNSPIP